MKSPIAVVVLAAGAGTRMKSALPKVLHPAGRMADGAPCAGERRTAEACPYRRRGGAGRQGRGRGLRPASHDGPAQAARHRARRQGRASRPQGPSRPGARGLCRCAADHDGDAAAPGRGLPQGQGRGRRAGLRRQRSVALRPADRARRHAGADRREPRCRCGREGDRLLQFRRHVPRWRADRHAAGRDQGRQRQERVLSHRRRRRGPRRRPRRHRRRGR